MNWRRVERWATIALYTAASIGAAIVLAEELLPDGSLGRRLAQGAAHYLTRLGDVGGGLLFVFVFAALLTMGGIWLMVLIAEGIDRLSTLIREMKGRSEQLKAEAREQGLEQGLAQGLEQGREQGLEQGREQGLEQGREQGLEQGREQGLEQGLERGREQGLEQGRNEMRDIIRERLEQSGINPDDILPPENPEA